MRSLLLGALLAGLLLACGAEDPSPPTDGGADAGFDGGPGDSGFDAGVDGGHPDAGQREEPYLTQLLTPADLAALTSTIGGGVKYLAPVDGRPAFPPLTEACYFQNMRQYSWHLLFLQSFPEHAGLSYDAYLALVLRRASRRLWGGAIQAWPGALHPVTQAPGVVAYGVYGEVGSLDVASIVQVDQKMKACIPFARDLLVFVPESPDQRALLARERANLLAQGVAALLPEDLVAGIPHLPYSDGEGYGTLRIIPAGQELKDDDYGPRDVVIVEGAPIDISIVAGLVTKNPQNALGHVNLRLQEKRIPNVAVPRIYDAAWVRALDGYLVHLVVGPNTFTLEPATLADAEAFWEANRPRVPAPRADLTVTTLEPFTTLRASGAIAYGAKAANLGELSRVLDPPNHNQGFGVPFSYYRNFAEANGVNAALEVALADPRLRTDATFKRSTLKALRDQLKAGTLDPAVLQAIGDAIHSVYGEAGRTQRLRFRSSTNVEDLEGLTGAGLYDSKSGCLADDLDGDNLGPSACLKPDEQAAMEAELAAKQAELLAHPERTWLAAIIEDLQGDLSEERPVAVAVKKVWASLYNLRAFDEREYYGIDHRLAYMGLAVNPVFALERASAVAVSNLTVDAGDPLYRLNSQLGTESVVRPEDPTAIAELLTFRRRGDPPTVADVQVLVESNRLPAGGRVWPDDKLNELGQLLFLVHDHFAREVYPELSPLRLDFELKYSQEGDVVIKQVRPFVGSEP